MATLNSVTLKNRSGETFTLTRENSENRLEVTLYKFEKAPTKLQDGFKKVKKANYRVANLEATARLVAMNIEGIEANKIDIQQLVDLLDFFIRM